jgi:hypothetical protein
MAITPVATGSFTESATSPLTYDYSVQGGANSAVGDFLLATVISREDSPTPVHGITTGGVAWTQIGSTRFLDIGTTGISLSNWYRFATAVPDANPSITCPTPNTLVAFIFCLAGVDSATPLDGVTVLGGTNAAAPTLQPNGGTGITTNTDNAWVICAVSTPDDNSLTFSVANGFSNVLIGASSALTDWASRVDRLEKASAGNQTAPTISQATLGNDEWAWQLFVLRAAVAADPQPTKPIVLTQAVGRSYSY